MALFVFRTLDGATQNDTLLQDGTLGYPHVILDDGAGGSLEIANVPPEAPPVGKFPIYDGAGALLFLVPFVQLDVSGGVRLRLVAWIYKRIDFSRRQSVGQFGDTITVETEMLEPVGRVPVDLTGALQLQMIFRRPDRVAMVRTATQVAGVGNEHKIEYQFLPGEADSAGEWSCQGYAILSGGAEFHGPVQTFVLRHNLPTS